MLLRVDWRAKYLTEKGVMARPRKYIHDSGKTVDGLSLHKSTGRFYSVETNGQRTYWGRDKTVAIQDFRTSKNPPPRRPPMTDIEAVDMLVDEIGLEDYEVTPNLIELAKETRRSGGSPSEADSFVAANPNHPSSKWYKQVGFTTKRDRRKSKGSRERLSHCLVEWWSIKLEGHTQPSTYMKDVRRSWDRFSQAIGNKSISLLTADDFATWRQWVTKEKDRRNVTAKWHNDQHKYVTTVFNTVKSERPSLPFPDGLLEWQVLPRRIKSRTKYVPNQHNKQPIPVDVFHAALNIAAQWADASVTQDSSTQYGRGKKRAALARRHRGLTAYAMFKIAANCGLDNADTAAVTWGHVKNFDGELPYLDMPRTKIKNRFLVETDRKIPLLPSTVAALRLLRDECQVADTISRTAHGSPHSRNSIYDQLEDALIEARLDSRFPDGIKQNRTAGKRSGTYRQKRANGWTFKHLRNVGGKKRLEISKEERDHFLGHVEAGETKWYTGEAREDYLVPLVNAIGAEYFDGGHVGTEDACRRQP